jgi:lysophospholipase L1-like esterase
MKPRKLTKDIIINLAVMFVTLVVFLIIAEICVRLSGYVKTQMHYDPKMYIYSSTKIYGLNPNYETCIWKDVVYKINSVGLRDEIEPDDKKSENVFRILNLGDSVTFGIGVHLKDTYAKKLEKLLNQKGEGKLRYEVINAGVPGYRTCQEIVLLKEVGLKYQPDLILIGFILNDAKPLPELPKSILMFASFLKSYSYLYTFVEFKMRHLRARIKKEEDNPDAFPYLKNPKNPGWKQCKDALREFSNICRMNNIKMLLVLIPPYVSSNRENYPYYQLHQMIEEVCNEYNIPFLDLLDVNVFAGVTPESIRISAIDTHPNSKGHQLIANCIYKYLIAHPEMCGYPVSHEG